MQKLIRKAAIDRSKAHFLIAHPQTALFERMNSVKNAFKRLNNSNFKEIIPEDYKNVSSISKFGDKEKYTGLFVSAFTPEEVRFVLENFPNIDWIQAIGTGIDKILLIPKANDESITITNLRSVSAELLAEAAMAGSLFFAKQFREYLDLADRAEWKSQNVYNVQALFGKTALVVSLGSIGTDIAKKCKIAFGMNVLGIDRDPKANEERLKGIVDKVYTLENLKEAVSQSHIIYNSLPFIKEWPMIFDEKVFSTMKKETIFVNIGRGSYVDEKALIATLKNGKLLGAALDVFANEPLKKDSPFYTDPEVKKRVLITCHNVHHSPFLFEKSEAIIYENLKRYLQGEQLMNVVNKNFGF